MLATEDVRELIRDGRERRALEFKGPGSVNDKEFMAKVARAVIAMSNLRGGGVVLIGFDERIPGTAIGMDADQLASWESQDDVADALGRYCDPPVQFEASSHQLDDGISIVAIEISEFEEVPTLAARDFPQILQRGVPYFRGLGKIESTSFVSTHELRELISLATEKNVRRFIQLSQRAGVQQPTSEPASALYERELETARISDLTGSISNRAHWHVSLRPLEFDADRIAFEDLEELIGSRQVKARGWYFPHIDLRRPIRNGVNWIGQDYPENRYAECWRLFTSGQIAIIRTLDNERSKPDSPDAGMASREVPLYEGVSVATESFELAARLALALPRVGDLSVGIFLKNARDWRVVTGNIRRADLELPPIGSDYIGRDLEVSSREIIANSRDHAIDAAIWIFQRAGWRRARREVLIDIQAEIFGPAE
jgi:hypothetical protein